jgi:hypothetical protein
MVANTYNPSTWKTEAGGTIVQGQPGYLVRPSLKKQTTTKKDNRNPKAGQEETNKNLNWLFLEKLFFGNFLKFVSFDHLRYCYSNR